MCDGVPRDCAGRRTIEACAYGFKSFGTPINFQLPERGNSMNNIVYIVGLIVIVIAILSFFGLR
ncbi:MAG TPA: hypothetical protein VF460_00090 [Burkholderiales bacterium]